jgi:hypothetical protein
MALLPKDISDWSPVVLRSILFEAVYMAHTGGRITDDQMSLFKNYCKYVNLDEGLVPKFIELAGQKYDLERSIIDLAADRKVDREEPVSGLFVGDDNFLGVMLPKFKKYSTKSR